MYHLPYGSENAWHVALAAYGVVAKGEGLPQCAEHHLVVREAAWHALRVNRYAVDLRAAAARGGLPLRHLPCEGLRSACYQRTGDGERGAGRSVNLGVVVCLNDLCDLEEAAEGLGDLHQQHRADGEVGGDENANAILLREGVNGLQFGVRDARCAGNPVNAALDRRSQSGGDTSAMEKSTITSGAQASMAVPTSV